MTIFVLNLLKGDFGVYKSVFKVEVNKKWATYYQNAKLKLIEHPKIVFSLPLRSSIIQQNMTVPNPMLENPQNQAQTRKSS